MDIKTKGLTYYILSAMIIFLSLAIAISGDFRSYLSNNILGHDKRKVLSVLNYKIKTDRYKIIKVRKNNSIYVEVYDNENTNKASFGLGKNLNGAIFLNGKTTELASYDLDKDGLKEVVIPTLSKNNKSLIFILKYNKNTKAFTLESPIAYIDQLGL